MDPRLQAGLELQLEKQAQQEYDSSLSGVLGQYFKQAGHEKTAAYRDERSRWERIQDSLLGKKHDPSSRTPDLPYDTPPAMTMPEPPGLPSRPEGWTDVMPRYPGLPKEQPTIGGKISSVYKDMLRKAYQLQKRLRKKRYPEAEAVGIERVDPQK